MFRSGTQRIAATEGSVRGYFLQRNKPCTAGEANRLLYLTLNANEMDSVSTILCTDY